LDEKNKKPIINVHIGVVAFMIDARLEDSLVSLEQIKIQGSALLVKATKKMCVHGNFLK
jgi:hypothetical protein